MNRRFFLDIDLGLLAPVLVLVTLSLATLFSIDFFLFRNQLLFFIIGIFALLFFSKINIKTVGLYSLPIYVISLLLLTIVLLIGSQTRGSVRWIEFLGFGIQFSEILKPFVAISFSFYLASNENYSLRKLFVSFFLLFPIVFLIFLQPDLGNTVIYVLTFSLAVFIFGFPLRFFLGGILTMLFLSPVLLGFLHDYQKQRILTFFRPDDPLGLSYNAIQSIIAVGAGMLAGRGLGLGTQSGLRFLPEFHTDFIFATISEELGFVGSFIVVLAFIFLLYRIYVIFSKQKETFGKIFSVIAFSLIFLQFFVSIGMNIGILPVVGITLPFVSYGGSSLLSNFILLGLLSAINKSHISEDTLEIK